MSIVSNTHTVTAYVKKVSKPLSGQRLALVTYKGIKAAGKVPRCVSVPRISIDAVLEHLDALKPHILGLVESAQNGLIRELVEAGKDTIQDEDISLEKILESMQSGGRLTGDDIKVWFDEAIALDLTIAFAAKLGIEEGEEPTPTQEKKLTQAVNGYRETFAKLAAGAATFSDTQKDQMLRALEFADDGDLLAARFKARLSKKVEDKADLLDF
jgi:hypothetical protein